MTRRTQRVNELLRQEISLVLQHRLRDPRLSPLISVTRVDTAEDLRNAKVYVSILGSKAKKNDALDGLSSAAGYLRKELGDVLPLKHVPSLAFVLDESIERGDAILEVLDHLSVGESVSEGDLIRGNPNKVEGMRDGQD
tara:strand:+ start:270 stop:686 length:417 start_codon:yes stop_codon:yes gene_type:complete